MKVEQGKVVSINYTLKDDEGKLLDTSVGSTPLEYIHGAGYILPKLEEQITGLNPGDKFSTVLSAKDGYGEYNDGKVVDVPRENFDTTMEIEEGMQFQAETTEGPAIVTVKKVTDTTVTVDGNHELAGVNLHFDIEIIDVRNATEEELSYGLGGGCGGGCGGCGGCDGGSCDSGECGGGCCGN